MSDDVQKVKDRLNIVDVIGQYVPLKRAGRTYSARCPFHKERTPSFHVSPERGTYMCFGCGEKGDVFSFVQKLDGIDFAAALRQLAERAGVELSRNVTRADAPQKKEQNERLREVCEAAVDFFEQQLKARADVQRYVRERGLTDDTAKHWRVGYAPPEWEALCKHMHSLGFSASELIDAGFAVRSEKRKGSVFDRFRGRIMFPIFDVNGDPVAVSGRFFEKVAGSHAEEEPAKYVNSPETSLFRKSKTLYGLDRAKNAMRKADCILLVEGQFDLLLSHQSGLPFAVALSGTALTPEHLTLLSRFSKRLVLALDADAAGLRAGLKSAQMALAAGFDVKIPTLPHGKDPADVARENPDALRAAVRTSQTAVEFFLNALWPTARDERAYKKIVEAQVLPLIAAMESRIDQAHFGQLVAMRLGVPEAAVLAEVSKVGRIAPRTAEEMPASSEVSDYEALAPIEKKIGMLLFSFEEDSDVHSKLAEVVGQERLATLCAVLAPQAETLRFLFDREVVEHTTRERIAEDMLQILERQAAKERFRRRFAQGID